MPTGYTAKLHDGQEQTLEEFILSCANAFAWWMRDSDSDTLTDPPAQTFQQRWLKEREAELDRLVQLSDEEVAKECEEEYQEKYATFLDYREKCDQIRARYEAMREKVENWIPPTSLHTGLKTFMLEQLETSIQHDCSYIGSAPLRPADVKRWHAERVERARSSLQNARQEAEKEAIRNSDNLTWTQKLRESLKGAT